MLNSLRLRACKIGIVEALHGTKVTTVWIYRGETLELGSVPLRGCKFRCDDINEDSLIFASGTISGGDDATFLLAGKRSDFVKSIRRVRNVQVAFYIGLKSLRKI